MQAAPAPAVKVFQFNPYFQDIPAEPPQLRGFIFSHIHVIAKRHYPLDICTGNILKRGYMKRATLQKVLWAGVILLGIFFINACKKDVSKVPAKSSGLIEYTSGSKFIRLTYSPVGEINSITLSNDKYLVGGEVTYKISYTEGKKLEELSGSNGIRIKPVYKSDRLVKADVYMNNELTYETVFQYAGNTLRNTIIKLVEKNVLTPVMKLESYYDAAGNPTTIDTYLANPVTEHMQLTGFVFREFDHHVNPFSGISDVMMVLLQPVSANNVIREKNFNTDKKVQEMTETDYTYDTRKLPVRATVKESLQGKDPMIRLAQFSYHQ
jgi:hypothetical protein